MNLLWDEDAWEDYLIGSNTIAIFCAASTPSCGTSGVIPFDGIGKPEPLRGDLAGWWSRRITADHRAVYGVRGSGEEKRLEIVACRYHYSPRR